MDTCSVLPEFILLSGASLGTRPSSGAKVQGYYVTGIRSVNLSGGAEGEKGAFTGNTCCQFTTARETKIEEDE